MCIGSNFAMQGMDFLSFFFFFSLVERGREMVGVSELNKWTNDDTRLSRNETHHGGHLHQLPDLHRRRRGHRATGRVHRASDGKQIGFAI